jgi:hypothetical protein
MVGEVHFMSHHPPRRRLPARLLGNDRVLSSRREFLAQGLLAQAAGISAACSIAAPVSAAPVSAAPDTRAAPQAKITETRVISRTPNRYCGWPTLVRRSNGELLLVYSGGRERHVCPFGRVEMMRSKDDGKSWSWPRILLDGPIDDRDAGVLETTQGSLLVSTFTSNAYEARLQQELERKAAAHPEAWTDEHIASWQAVHERVGPKQREQELGQWMIRSTDGGVTWSARYPVPVDCPHGPIQLADGRLLYAGQKLWHSNREIEICQSEDDGLTWSKLADLPVRDGDLQSEYHELHVVEWKPQKLVMHIRNHNVANKNETLQSESSDGGSTWTVPHSIGVWGLPSHLLKLRDGRLLMSYGYRRPPYGNQARVSEDGGVTWSDPIAISSDGFVFDLGYPSTVQLDDGSLITVWYEKMFGSYKAVLRQARWSLES